MGGLVQPPPAARAHRKRTAGRSRSALLRSEGGACPSRVIQAKTPPRNPERFSYYHAGQVCVSTQRIFVHADIEAEFLERFTTRVRALRVGDPLRLETEVGPLIQPRETDRVTSWVEEATSRGGQVLV